MRALQVKNNKYQYNYKKAEKIRIVGKFMENYFNGCNSIKKLLYQLKSFKILRKYYFTKTSRTRINTRCIFTNRSRSTYKKYSVSRFVLRDFIQFGFLPGYKKAVW
jgi:ribosomal protein S14